MSIYLLWGFWYAVCGLIVTNLLQAWLSTSFALHVWNFIFAREDRHRVYGRPDLIATVYARYGALGDLFVCPVCCGTWLALASSATVALAAGLSPWFIVISSLSLPGLAAKFVPAYSAPGLPAKTEAAEHPIILDLVRSMAASPDEALSPLWLALQRELNAPTSDKAKEIVATYKAKLKLVKDDAGKMRLQRATLGKLYDSGIRN